MLGKEYIENNVKLGEVFRNLQEIELDIYELDLPVSVFNLLKRAKVDNLQKILSMSLDDLAKFGNERNCEYIIFILSELAREYFFPFGQKLKKVEQKDRTPKKVFILGVYASAVHAKWIDAINKKTHPALIVASEPYIFWNGDISEAKQIIDEIKIPPEFGKLEPAEAHLNGPSGRCLDEHILKPLELTRTDVWLCDLMPETRLNPKQKKRIRETYNPLISKYGLNPVTIPPVPKILCDENRRKEITQEIKESEAKTLVLLGDDPIKQYLKYVTDIDFKNLDDYTKKHDYGTPYPVVIDSMELDVILFTHPRQIAQLGLSDKRWYNEHKKWETKKIQNMSRRGKNCG